MAAALWMPGCAPAGHRGAATICVLVTKAMAGAEGTNRPRLLQWCKQNICVEAGHVRWVAAVPLPAGHPHPAPNVNHHPFPF